MLWEGFCLALKGRINFAKGSELWMFYSWEHSTERFLSDVDVIHLVRIEGRIWGIIVWVF